jgi:hypothetical protein
LVGLTLAGVGLATSQLPYGRILTAGLGGAGLLVAGLGVLAADRKKFPPAAASAVAFLAVLIAVAFPTWLGHTTWLPPRPEVGPQGVLAVGHAGGDRTQAVEWVDGSQASWQQGDVRVTVRSAAVAPVELVGPSDQKKRTREKYLQIGLRVVNVGVARRFEFVGLAATPPAGAAPRLTDSTGKVLAAKRFEGGFEPAGAGPDQKALAPGKTAEYVLVFEPPAKGAEYLRLEFPPAAYGGETPVRFHIPMGFIATR